MKCAKLNRKEVIFLFLIIILGILLRLNFSNRIVSDEPAHFTEAIQIARGEIPFYQSQRGYLLSIIRALTFRLTGYCVFCQRFLVLIFGVGVIYLTYYLGKILYDEKVGLLSSFLVSIFPLFVSLSRSIMNDMVGIFFSLLATCLYIKGLEERNKKMIWTSGIALGLGLLCNPFVFLFLFVIFFYFLLERRKELIMPTIVLYAISFSIWGTWLILDFSSALYLNNVVWGLDIITWRPADYDMINNAILPILSHSGLFLMIFGIIYSLVRRRKEDVFLLLIITLLFVWIEFLIAPKAYGRFESIFVPFIFILFSKFYIELSKNSYESITNLFIKKKVKKKILILLPFIIISLTLTIFLIKSFNTTIFTWKYDDWYAFGMINQNLLSGKDSAYDSIKFLQNTSGSIGADPCIISNFRGFLEKDRELKEIFPRCSVDVPPSELNTSLLTNQTIESICRYKLKWIMIKDPPSPSTTGMGINVSGELSRYNFLHRTYIYCYPINEIKNRYCIEEKYWGEAIEDCKKYVDDIKTCFSIFKVDNYEIC